MKFPSIPSIPSQLISEPSQTDIKYMDDDDEDYPSLTNLQMYMVPNNSMKDGQSIKEKTSGKAEIVQSKVPKKKSVVKEQKGNSSVNSLQIKRTQSQTRTSNLNYTKLYSRKSSQFRQVKFSQFQLIYKTFNMFSSQFISFNELILGLKSLGVEISTEKKFQSVKNIFDEFVGKNDVGLDFEMFGKIAIRLLKEEKSKSNSDLCLIEKGFYYMVQEANRVKWPFEEEQIQNSQKELYNEFKWYVDRLPTDKKYLTKDSLTNLAKYLGMEKQLTQNDIDNIMKYGDKEDKGYMSLEDVIKCIQGNKIVDV